MRQIFAQNQKKYKELSKWRGIFSHSITTGFLNMTKLPIVFSNKNSV